MEFNFILPENFEEQSVSHLLEKTWLVPRKQRYFLRIKKHFLLNGRPATEFDRVVKSDQVTLIFDESDFPSLRVPFGDATQAALLYEDEHLVIANKPEGMKTHGNQPGELALQNHVAAAVGHPVFVVHRLDTATSGAMLFAKNQFVLPILGQLFEQNKLHRDYLALIQGHLPAERVTLQQPIGRDRHDKRKQIVSKNGKPAVTHLTVLSNFKKTSLVNCLLDTGRTHQIRVHLAAFSHPIIGDTLYGAPSSETRLMLHAEQLRFQHPFTGAFIKISAPSPSFKQRCAQEK